MEKEFEGKVAIITGGGQGMGRSVAQKLSLEGANVIVNDKNLEALSKVVNDLTSSGASAVAAPGDVTKKDDVDAIVATALDEFGAVDILVNNAGILFRTRLLDMEEEEWDLVINVNMLSLIHI